MSARPHRRGLLALLGTAPIAAAAGGAGPAALALGRLAPGFAGGRFAGAAARLAPVVERAHPLLPEIPGRLTHLAAALDQDFATVAAELERAAWSHAWARLAAAYPAEIDAYRSFGAPMRQRLYAQMLEREAARLSAAQDTFAAPQPDSTSGDGRRP